MDRSLMVYDGISGEAEKMMTEPKEGALPEVISDVLEELVIAGAKFQKWHRHDVVRAVAMMAEESGETVQAANQADYEGAPIARVYHEAKQTAAMALRVMFNLHKKYERQA